MARMTSRFGMVARRVACAGATLALAVGGVPSAAWAATGAQGAADVPIVGAYANPEYNNQVGASSTGDTKLYVIGKQDDLTTPEGAVNEQLKVSIPVALHYVASVDATGKGVLTGPSDDVVKFVNHTRLGAVHVSKIKVDGGTGVDIAPSTAVGSVNDRVSFTVQPVQGQSDADGATFTPVGKFTSEQTAAYQGNADNFKVEGTPDELGNYSTTATGANAGGGAINPRHKNDWNIAQKDGALGLNKLSGSIGGFGTIDPATDYQVGTVHWTVRAGTRKQADTRDATVTVHFNANNGSNKNCVPVADQAVVVLNVAELPEKVALDEAGRGVNTVVTAGTGVEGPKSVTNADGTVTTWTFKEWNTQPDGGGTTVSTIGNLGSAADIAGKSFEVYAIYE